MDKSVWVEVHYTVVITEKGTAIMKVAVPFDLDNPMTLIKAIHEVARSRAHEVVTDKNIMAVENISSNSKPIRLYVDDGTGKPNLNSPIDISTIEELAKNGDSTD